MAAHRVTRALLSGWVPAGFVLAVVTSLQLGSGTQARDLIAFGFYALLCLVVPGTLLWRLLRPAKTQLWLDDVVFGTILAYAIEILSYLVARSTGYPLLVVTWPVLMYGFAVLTRRGRLLWRSASTSRVPTWWSWSVAAISTYLVLFIARANWWETGVSGERLRIIGPDAAFQLAMTGELRHHVPPTVSWVAGEPLHYHWFTYVHTAAATWMTAIEPIVMLRRLAPLIMTLLVVLAVALIAHRLSARPTMGPLAAGLLVLVHSPAFYAAETDHFQRQEFTSPALFGSPTMTFGSVLFCGTLVVVTEILREKPRGVTWGVLALLMAATTGAKATFAPMLVAAALAVLVVSGATRSITKAQLALAGLATVVWLAFQFGFYGGDAAEARLTTRGTLDFAAPSFGAETPASSSVGGIALIGVILLLWAVHMAGMLGLLPAGGWRNPLTVFLWGFTIAGLGASALLELSAASQQWFVNSTQAAVAVGAALGLGRLLAPLGTRGHALRLAVPAATLAVIGMAVGWLVTPSSPPPAGPVLSRLWSYAAPFLLTVLVLASVAIVIAASRSRFVLRSPGLLFLCVGLTALGLFRTIQISVALAQVPWSQPGMPDAASTPVGDGGVETARWIRETTSPADLLATNAHTLTPESDLQLSFWLAGYSERRVLIESWGYTTRHSRLVVEERLGFDEVPYWRPRLLALNDRAFTEPSRNLLTKLRDDHGVEFLVVDRRFPSDSEALSALVRPALVQGDYVVYDLGDLS